MNNTPSRLLRLNVGFLLKENAGYSREFEFGEPRVQVAGDLEMANLRGTLRLTRTPQGIYAQGRLSGEISSECGRCLTAIALPLSVQIADLFIYPPEHATDPQLVVGEEGFIDLGPVLREGMLLSVPLRPLCRPDCRGLCPECGINRNDESCEHGQGQVDPRLAVLSSLLKE